MHILNLPPELQINRLFDGMIQKNAYFPSQIGPPMRVDTHDNYTVINSGHKTDTFNLVISKTLGGHARSIIERVTEEFNNAALPAAWWTCDEARDPEVPAMLHANGFVEDETDVGMLSDLDQLPDLAYPPGLQLHMVEAPSDILAFGEIIASLFDPPDTHIVPFYTLVARRGNVGTWPLKLVLGKADGRAVATAALYIERDTAHIFDISTLSDARNRGYGSAITHFALTCARDRQGPHHSALQASPDGLKIYERMGFRKACTFRIYSNREMVSHSEKLAHSAVM